VSETVATFSIPYTQYLNEEGKAVQELPELARDPDALLELYRIMVRVRIFDAKAIALQRTGKMGTYASSLGHEAISTVIGHVMRKDDVFVPCYREHAALIQRNTRMEDIFSYWGGDERGNAAEGCIDLPVAVPIASQCLHASGIATAFKLRNEPRVAVTVFGDGATSQGDFYEAINVAGVWDLPAVFVISNNKWAISVPLEKQTATQTLAQKAIAAGITGQQVDGNDVFAMHAAFSKALEDAREGKGAQVIEAMTYRLCDHTTADDASRYRPEGELQTNEKFEPIQRLKTYLETEGLWDDAKEAALKEEAQAEVEKAVETYLNRPQAPATDMVDYLFAELPDALKSQRKLLQEF